MKNNIHRKKVFTLLASIFLLTISENSISDTFSSAIVKLYSDGKVVDKWKAINRGKMEGQCFVFNIKKGVYNPQVRVCGTFSVEEKK